MNTRDKILVFEPNIRGHVLEYIHHIWEYAACNDISIFFLLPDTFKEQRKKLIWSESPNIDVGYITENERIRCTQRNLLLGALARSLVLRKYMVRENARCAFVSFLMLTMPFAPFLIPRGCQINGVVYRIYLYDARKKNLRLLAEKVRYTIMARMNRVGKVFILNDSHIAQFFNMTYHTKKFTYLVDPIPVIDKQLLKDVRSELGFNKTDTVYCLFGQLDGRKSTIDLLEAICMMSEDQLLNKAFIFAGKVTASQRDIFYKLMDKAKKKTKIYFEEGFIPYERLNNLCFSSDCILTLYRNTQQSSGSVGYAAYLGKPVIGPAKGLLGQLIRDYNLGIIIDEISPQYIKQALLMDLPSIDGSSYSIEHTTEKFCYTIFTILSSFKDNSIENK